MSVSGGGFSPQDRDIARAGGRVGFDELIARLQAAVGGAHVLSTPDEIERRSNCTIPWQRDCAVVVYPADTEQVRQVVRIAADCRYPLWPFSRGKNWGYGTTLATQQGAVIMILERMDRILEVNEELAYAVIEPGVTQRELNAYLKDNGHKLWTDCTDSTPEGSVLGNALERGVGYTPYGDHFGHLCGLEVVLADGELVRTGGGGQGCPTWHTHKWGVGPYLEGLFSQSGLGVVTRGGIWLMPEPQAFNFFTFEVPDERNFAAVTDAFRRLALHRTVSNVHFINDFALLTSLMQYPYELRDGTRIAERAMARLRRELRLNPWTVIGGLYGTRAQVRAQRSLISKELKRYGRLMFFDDRMVGLLTWLADTFGAGRRRGFVDRVLKLATGRSIDLVENIPRMVPYLKGVPGEFVVSSAYFKRRGGRVSHDVDPVRDGCGLIWFAPVVPATGRHVSALDAACRPLFERYGFEYPLSLLMLNPRSLVMLFSIFYDRDDADEAERARRLYEALNEVSGGLGYQQYRTGVAYMDRILRDAPGFHRVAESIKSALDPAGVLAPGRYGVDAREILPGGIRAKALRNN